MSASFRGTRCEEVVLSGQCTEQVGIMHPTSSSLVASFAKTGKSDLRQETSVSSKREMTNGSESQDTPLTMAIICAHSMFKLWAEEPVHQIAVFAAPIGWSRRQLFQGHELVVNDFLPIRSRDRFAVWSRRLSDGRSGVIHGSICHAMRRCCTRERSRKDANASR